MPNPPVISQIPLALYIHIPWCVKKCPYCDFNSHTLQTNTDFANYVDALLADAKSQIGFVQGRQISSVFIGGGTPSLLPIQQYQRLFDGLRAILPFANDVEVTMEANPATIEHAPFEQYLQVGINRLSIGVQTFDSNKLAMLGRIHNAEQAELAVKSALQAGFKRVNVDLMHGLPEQTADEALYDIERAIQIGATHLSWYQLTIEPNTVFYRNTPVLPVEDTLEQIEQQGSQLLIDKGFKNYEVSAWVSQTDERKDKPCRHNINYWQFGDYLAIGAGAHGKISLINVAGYNDGIYRFSKSRLPKDYLNFADYPKMVGFNKIAEDELAGEFMLDALRLTDGVPMAMFSERTGIDLSSSSASEANTQAKINTLQNQGLLIPSITHIKTTQLGRQYLNQLIQQFI